MPFLYHSCQICWSEAVLFLQETHQGLCGLLGFLQCQSCLKCSNFSGEISCAHAPSASSFLAKSREQVFPPLSIYRHRERGRASVETGSLTHSQRASDWGRGCRCAPPLLCVLFFSLCRKQLVIWEKRAAADRGEGEFPVASSRMHLVVDSCQDAVLKMLPYFVDNAFVTQRQIYHMWVNRSLKWNRRWCRLQCCLQLWLILVMHGLHSKIQKSGISDFLIWKWTVFLDFGVQLILNI